MSTALIWVEQSRTKIARKDAEDKQELAEKREAEAKAQQSRAEENLRTVLSLVRHQQDLFNIVKDNPQSGVTPEGVVDLIRELVTVLEKLRADRLDDPEHLFRLVGAHHNFGEVLAELGLFPEAEGAYCAAITDYTHLVADFPATIQGRGARAMSPAIHRDLAELQRADGRLAEAEESYRKTIQIVGTMFGTNEPSRPGGQQRNGHEAYYLCGLARCLLAGGRTEDAERIYRRAMELVPNWSQINLGRMTEIRIGWAWFLATRPDAAHRDPGRAVELMKQLLGPRVTNAKASSVLGVAQYRTGDWKGAAATLADVVQLRWGRENGARFFLAMALWQMGEKDKARQQYEQAREWTDKYRPKDEELRRFHAEAAQLLGINEQIELAMLGKSKNQFAAAARLFAAAFAAEPKLADDLSTGDRQAAAQCAALAGCGQGQGAAQLDENERALLRQQALDWLRADLDWLAKQPQGSPSFTPQVRERMEHWQRDGTFAGVRDKEALAKLPEAERKEWQKLWADVADTLARAKGKNAAEQKPGVK